MKPLPLLFLAAITVLLAGCNDDAAPTEATTTARIAKVCFKAHDLQTLGGERLAAIDAYEEDDAAPVVSTTNMRGVFNAAFEPSLRGDLRRVERSDTEESQAIVDAANTAIEAVDARPRLLLDEAALESTFADAQELAEQADATTASCR